MVLFIYNSIIHTETNGIIRNRRPQKIIVEMYAYRHYASKCAHFSCDACMHGCSAVRSYKAGTSVGVYAAPHQQHKYVLRSTKGLCKDKKFQKSEITMEVGGWVQVSLGTFFWNIIPKQL